MAGQPVLVVVLWSHAAGSPAQDPVMSPESSFSIRASMGCLAPMNFLAVLDQGTLALRLGS